MNVSHKEVSACLVPGDWDHLMFGALYIEPSRNGIYKTEEFKGRGTRIVNMGEMFGYEFISDQEMDRVELTAKELSTSRLREGDLLFGRRSVVPAGAGKCSLVLSSREAITFESSIIRARLDQAQSHPLFYYYFFASSVGRATVGTIVSGTNIKGIRATELRGLEVPKPTKKEQIRIATALFDVDILIDSLEQLLTKKRQIMHGAMQDMLMPKRGDQVRSLREVSTLKGRIGWQGLKQTEFTTNDGQPFLITGMNFKDGAIRWDEVYHIPESRYEMAPEIQLRPNDLLMTKDGTIGKVLYIDSIPYPGTASLNSHLLLFRPIRGSYNPKYMYYQLGSKRFKDFVEQSKSGTTFFGLSQTAVGMYPVLLPPIEDQNAIAAVLTDMDLDIGVTETKLTKARQLKQGMMQVLLTGQIRLIEQHI